MSREDDAFDDVLGAPTSSAPAPAGTTAHAARAAEFVGARATSPGVDEFVAGLPVYRDAVLAGSAAGLVLGVLGVFVVLRRGVFVTAAVTQAAGLGVALAFFAQIQLGIGLPPWLGALLASLAASALFALRSASRFSRETQIGIAYLGTSALAVLVGDRISREAHDVAAILFGTAVLVRPEDLLWIASIGAGTLCVLLCLGRGLVFSGFDPDGARVQGLPVRRLELTLWGLVAVSAAVSARALGSLPVFAFMVLPAAGALSVARGMRSAWTLAGLLGAIAGAAGYLVAFLLELPVGASQAAVSGALAFVLAAGGALVRRS